MRIPPRPTNVGRGLLRIKDEFAKRMAGNLNPDMIMTRSDWEIFRDDFRGKLGEVGVVNYIETYAKSARIDRPVDFDVMPRGQWDLTDMIVNGKYLSVKSVKGKSNFLLLETFRYNEDGTIAYLNDNNSAVKIDLYVLVRVDIYPEIGRYDLNFSSIDELCRKKERICCSVLGGITHKKFWKIKHTAPEGMVCTRDNLYRICHGEKPIADPNTEWKPEILQKTNYVVSRNELDDLYKLL